MRAHLLQVLSGVMAAAPGAVPNRDALLRLWLHEQCRVFGDRLVCESDVNYFNKLLVELAIKHGLGNPSYDELFGAEAAPLMWGDFLRPGLER